MHVILDGVLARGWLARTWTSDRSAFATFILRRIGLGGRELAAARRRVLASMPRDLDAVDMNELLAVLEVAVPFAWENDVRPMDPRRREELLTACTAILAARERPSPPEPLAAAIVEELRAVVGEELDDLDRLRAIAASRILHEVWQCKRGEERALAERRGSHPR